VLPKTGLWKWGKQEYLVKNGIPEIWTEKHRTFFIPIPAIYHPVTVFPVNTKMVRVKTEYGTGQNEIFPVRFHP
jgi:hypothetical protein